MHRKQPSRKNFLYSARTSLAVLCSAIFFFTTLITAKPTVSAAQGIDNRAVNQKAFDCENSDPDDVTAVNSKSILVVAKAMVGQAENLVKCSRYANDFDSPTFANLTYGAADDYALSAQLYFCAGKKQRAQQLITKALDIYRSGPRVTNKWDIRDFKDASRDIEYFTAGDHSICSSYE